MSALAFRSAPRAVLLACAAIAAGTVLLAATEPAHAFKRAGVMRSAIATPAPHSPSNVEVVVKVLDGRGVHTRSSKFKGIDQVYIPTR
jgi:hypothetical protein